MIEMFPPSDDSKIIAPVLYRANSHEHVLSYQKIGDQHVEMVLSHEYAPPGEQSSEPTFTIAIYHTVNNPNMIPFRMIELSMEEARFLRDFLNRPEVQGYLEQE